MQFDEWMSSVRVLCAVFHISPQDLGFTFDINKSTGEVQQENTESNGALPSSRWQDFMTAEVCQDPMFGGIANNIKFQFRAVSFTRACRRLRCTS